MEAPIHAQERAERSPRIHGLAARFTVFLVAASLGSMGPPSAAPAQDEDAEYGEDLDGEERSLATDEPDLGPIEGAEEVPESGLEGGQVGYELAMAMPDRLLRGRVEQFSGIAYVVGAADALVPTRGLAVEVSLLSREIPGPLPEAGTRDPDAPPPAPRANPFRLVQRASVTSGAGGVFSLPLSVPDEEMPDAILVVRVARPGRAARRYVSSIGVSGDVHAMLLTDRNLYEAGETLHAWVLVTEGESGRPIPSTALTLAFVDAFHRVVAEQPLTTTASGAASLDFPIASSFGTGELGLIVYGAENQLLASRNVSVGERHLERMRLEVGLTSHLVAPGEPLTGMVQVIAADSTPIADAAVVFQPNVNEETRVTVITDRNGQATFSLGTPTYLAGDSQVLVLEVVVSHPAHGSATARESYTLSRTPYFVEVTPEGGALPVDTDAEVFVAVENALGEEGPAGLTVELRGPSVVGSPARVVSDAHGLGRIRVHVPRTAVARTDGGDCSGQPSTEVIATITRADGRPPRDARLCIPVSMRSVVMPRIDRAVAAPGDRVEVTLSRQGGRRFPVLLELLEGSRARAHAFAGPSETRVGFDVPASARGVLSVRARPVTPESARNPIDDWGATFLGDGAAASFIVRPSDAFATSLSTDAPRYPVRGRMRASLSLSVPPREGAWATVVVRDEAWHAGEEDYALFTWSADLRDMIRTPTAEHDLALRYALVGMTPPVSEPVGEMPVDVPPWMQESVWERAPNPSEGIGLDPISIREVLRRQTYPLAASTLEQLLASMPEYDDESVASLLTTVAGHTRFAEDVFAQLERMALGEVQMGLGGLPISPANIERANIGFSFDIAAARVARARLVTLLGVLATVAGTTDPAIVRLFAVEPPERWLALAVQHGFVDANLLLDPWGRPYVFRDAAPRVPAILLSERAPNWELVSAGADGRYGTGDDVRDPFARVVPERTIYAETSGENTLIAELSRIAPGPDALGRMAAAYRELGLAAEDERIPSAVFAYASEAYAEGDELAGYVGEGESFGFGGLGMIGTGSGGGGTGSGYGSGSGRLSGRSSSVPRVRMGTAVSVAASALARVVREDFPATLFFVGEVPFDAAGRAELDVTLADAVTTYRIEAIAWGATGWMDSTMARITVDQTVQIDAPIPETARVGDRILVPVRIVNRGSTPIRVRPEVTLEGGLGASLGGLEPVVVPPMDGVALRLELAAEEVSDGAVRIEALADDGERLDAVRRPLRIEADARPMQTLVQTLLERNGELALTVPDDALSGTGEVRVWLGSAIFGDLSGAGYAALAAWAAAVRGDAVDPSVVELLESSFPRDPEIDPIVLEAGQIAAIVGGLYGEPRMSDAVAAAYLRALSRQLSDGSAAVTGALLGLSAAARQRDRRPLIAELLDEVLLDLRNRVADEGARATESPETWAHVAAALALTANPDDIGRTDEMLRRIERHVIRLERATGSIAWLEPDVDDGSSIEPRVSPTALLALALIGRGRPADALPFLRALAEVRDGALGWVPRHRALVIAAVGLLTSGIAGAPRLWLDGAPLTPNADGLSFALAETSLGVPGTHLLRAELPEGMLAFAQLSADHLVPWDRPIERPLHVEASWSGEVGGRDTRTALVLEIRNRSPRVVARPVVDIQLPSGAELDTEARRLLERAGTVSILAEGARITLAPLRVGAVTRISLRARMTLAGSLRGLGVTIRDRRSDGERIAVLPSRAVDVPEDAPEPVFEELEPSGVPEPVPLPIDPMPRRLVESLAGL